MNSCGGTSRPNYLKVYLHLVAGAEMEGAMVLSSRLLPNNNNNNNNSSSRQSEAVTPLPAAAKWSRRPHHPASAPAE